MLLELSEISKSFEKREVLKKINFKVKEGETIAIIGPSGSGKTTLLNIIGGLDAPDSGSAFFNGNDIINFTEKERAHFRNSEIGFVFQMHYLLPQCTVFENVLIPTLAIKNKINKNIYEKRAIDLLERVGLKEMMNQIPGELSVGECQRAAFVRALINSPKLILADEPTGSLDSENAVRLGQLLLELNKENKTTLIVVTHSSGLAEMMDSSFCLQEYSLTKKR
ncbi:MAG: hypothetical protein A2275_18125 [Bacteroidetes bacterium RIFOXYA12_FULL_35_11]|nr:MAG: hypothetical protein A2X01_21250 [Bacteroidetes bacterium GWF2_35_48]OFY82181.1 MAG: hypothetical protein A2275_18125 [Bacteroidetes bacterium RIFOXYA12_FULL_35_11]OFY95502.1 MAG: hypothetical protein A2491_03780 [Bacteroidetes bacterium RIFOXYC12_FULL_35_7]OFY97681.1 MAG: hypothetical protein A2309_05525 [Bacteroidetes bacterium RIFOXYB2_FULL_35_7]HBX50475.1 ABC transporter [Bacteroidales bacterium]